MGFFDWLNKETKSEQRKREQQEQQELDKQQEDQLIAECCLQKKEDKVKLLKEDIQLLQRMHDLKVAEAMQENTLHTNSNFLERIEQIKVEIQRVEELPLEYFKQYLRITRE